MVPNNKHRWIYATLSICLIISITLFIQVQNDKKELNDYWVSNSVDNFTGDLLSSKSRISNILQEKSSTELELGMLYQDLNSAFTLSNTMTSSMVSPQYQTWTQIWTSFEKVTRTVDTIASDFNKEQKLTDNHIEQLEDIKSLVGGLLNILKNEDAEIRRFKQDEIEKIEELTSEFYQ